MTGARADPPLEDWAPRFEAAVAPLNHLRRVFVVATTQSTQDAAARLDAHAGDVIVAGRQTDGRGRRGKRWADTGAEGVAVTIVVPAEPTLRLAAAFAVGAAQGVQVVLGSPVGIKWPNDLMVDGRKLGGILIEQSDGLARAGIGINVHQSAWPRDLADRAVSLRQLGAATDRVTTLEAILAFVDQALGASPSSLEAAWASRDALAGTDCVFVVGGREVRGRVLRVDPLRGLAVETTSGEVWLDAATTVRVDGVAGGAQR